MSDTQKQRKQKRQRDQVVAKAIRNRDRTRRKLLAQGRELARRRAENVERGLERAEGTQGSNTASAHSTAPTTDSNAKAAARHSHSTVPAQPKGSTVPAAVRLYGLELYEQIRVGADSQGDTAVEGEPDAPVDHPSPDGEATDGGEGQ